MNAPHDILLRHIGSALTELARAVFDEQFKVLGKELHDQLTLALVRIAQLEARIAELERKAKP